MNNKPTLEFVLPPECKPEAAFDKFFDWYPKVWLHEDDLVSNLKNMPRPLRELAVMHQAFGVMSSGGPSSYYLYFDRAFDQEIMLGLGHLDLGTAFSTIEDGRNMFEASKDGELSLEQNAEIYGRLPLLTEIESSIGRWLLKNLKRP